MVKPRLCSRHLLRLENPCYPAEAGFHDFGPRHIGEYACGPKSFQLRVSQWFPTPRYDAYCTIWVKGHGKERVMLASFFDLSYQIHENDVVKRQKDIPVDFSKETLGLVISFY